MSQGSRRTFMFGVFMLVVIGIAAGGYFTFRRTLIADVRETLMNVDESDPIVWGETLFQTRGCSGCHTFTPANSVGDVGPNLDGIASRHPDDPDYIRTSIVNPNAVIAEDCPEGACASNLMPQYGSILNDEQVNALVAYLSAP